MEDDDRAVAGIVFYHVEDTVRRHMRTVIACHHVPHDNLVFLPQGYHLRETHMTVRRPVQVAVDISGSLLDVIQVILRPILKSLNMMEGVIAYPVSAIEHHLINFRVFADIVSYTEEGRLHTIFVEYIQNP